MSMLTAQVGKLRETAADLREHSTFVGFGGVVNRDPVLIDAARQMEDAADTIENLRDRLTDTKEVETCRMTLCAAGNDYARYGCSECERETMVPHVVEGMSRDYERPRYCVNCGRKVVG